MLRSLGGKFEKAASSVIGVRERLRTHVGSVILRNSLPETAKLCFSKSSLAKSKYWTTSLHSAVVDSGEEYTFDLGESKDFDFWLTVYAEKMGKISCSVMRGGVYKICMCEHDKIAIQSLQLPNRRCSDLLATEPALSFSFSASGWLFVYQLGVAECLQNHGICKNPYIRVSGSSGGALTAATMMYGCDMRALRDQIKSSAASVRSDVSKAADLRSFILEAMKAFVRDGSIKHPAFQSGRVEIAVSESCFEASQSMSSRFGDYVKGRSGMVRSKRCREFGKTSDAVVALLASATMGISGLPFKWTNEDGKEVRVADGGITDFMPTINEYSITVKPFSDGLDLFGKTRPDVTPTEFVPGSYGLWPPKPSVIDHIYELGYQDMDEWLELNLTRRIVEARSIIAPLEQDLSPVEFKCADDGMTWLDEVLQAVPIRLSDQVSKSKRQSGTSDQEDFALQEAIRRSLDDKQDVLGGTGHAFEPPDRPMTPVEAAPDAA